MSIRKSISCLGGFALQQVDGQIRPPFITVGEFLGGSKSICAVV